MHGRLFDNLVAFGRLLRTAGIPIGPAQMTVALAAVELAGLRRRRDFYWALAGSLLSRPEQRRAFDYAFEMFWGLPDASGMELDVEVWRADDRREAGDDQSTGEVPLALLGMAASADGDGEDGQDIARDSASDRETLKDKHFDRMDADELAEARRALSRLRFALPPYPTRRRRRDAAGTMLDWRRSFRAVTRSGGALAEMARASRREALPALIVLCDVSGSMQVYSRVMLHFICAVAAVHPNTHAFLMGTRLSDITRQLHAGEIATAVQRICAETRDFDGGTRIGEALSGFNKLWARRLLSRKAIVVLVTDGLEGAAPDLLEAEVARLARSCGHLMWLNPLLRFAGFEPKAAGIQAILRHADSVHPVHSLRCVAGVATALASALSSVRRAPVPMSATCASAGHPMVSREVAAWT